MTNPCLSAALSYAARGWRVLPLHVPQDGGCSCRELRNCETPGKHPRVMDWKQKASSDPTEIDRWWSMWPDSNVGILCGDGLAVLDVDSHGFDPLSEFLKRHGTFKTASVLTGSDCGHFYFRAPADAPSFDLAPGLEVRSNGRLVVAPPSVHASGRRYEWQNGHALTAAPEWMLRKPRAPTLEDGEKIPPGGRHAAMLRIAGAMRRVSADQATIQAALLRFNAERCDPPKDEDTVRELAADVVRRYPPAENDALQEQDDLRADDEPDTGNKGGTKSEEDILPPYFPVSKVRPTPIGDAAYHGLAGRIVRLIEPHSEAAPEALLVQLLVAVGNAMGRTVPAYVAEDDHHLGRLFAAIVGPTSRARKGTSWGRIKHVMRAAAPGWANERLRHGGLSSGEGLIEAFRWTPVPGLDELIRAFGMGDQDELERLREEDDAVAAMLEAIEGFDPEDGVEGLFKALTEAERAGDDEPADLRELPDGRLLVIEAEFSRVLRVCKREHSTTAAVLRTLWDDDEANVLTRNKPLSVRGAHLSIIAHITQAELRRELSDMDAMNGFANRFLFVYAERSKLLPYGGQVPEQALDPLVDELAAAIEAEPGQETIIFDARARELWEPQYSQLTAKRPGLYGDSTARAEVQVVRLALIYALLDQSRLIRIEHLQAALEIWRYCDESARYLFGGRLGDRVAEYVMGELEQSEGGYLDRIDIYKALGHKVTKAEINVALENLEAFGLIRRESVPTKGRPIERIHLV